jgi:type IV secretory pathway protease TraF
VRVTTLGDPMYVYTLVTEQSVTPSACEMCSITRTYNESHSMPLGLNTDC